MNLLTLCFVLPYVLVPTGATEGQNALAVCDHSWTDSPADTTDSLRAVTVSFVAVAIHQI
jgi:hypothetical protein